MMHQYSLASGRSEDDGFEMQDTIRKRSGSVVSQSQSRVSYEQIQVPSKSAAMEGNSRDTLLSKGSYPPCISTVNICIFY